MNTTNHVSDSNLLVPAAQAHQKLIQRARIESAERLKNPLPPRHPAVLKNKVHKLAPLTEKKTLEIKDLHIDVPSEEGPPECPSPPFQFIPRYLRPSTSS